MKTGRFGGLLLAARFHPSRLQKVLGSTMRSSGQLYIRLAVVLIAVMAFVANELGLDFLLGAFTAGVLYRIFLLAGAEAREREEVESKLEAVTFGYLIPIFFVCTGVRFDLGSLSSPTALLKIPLFLALFLVVRGLPILLYRKEIPDRRERGALRAGLRRRRARARRSRLQIAARSECATASPAARKRSRVGLGTPRIISPSLVTPPWPRTSTSKNKNNSISSKRSGSNTGISSPGR